MSATAFVASPKSKSSLAFVSKLSKWNYGTHHLLMGKKCSIDFLGEVVAGSFVSGSKPLRLKFTEQVFDSGCDPDSKYSVLAFGGGEDIRVRPCKTGLRFIDLFAGIGGMRVGFEALGGTCVFTSEWDAKAQQTYELNFGEKPFGDITTIDPGDIPDHEVLLAGFPCQPFSIIGNRKGFGDTRGTLFYSIQKIIEVKQPEAVLLENVKQFRTHDDGRTCRTVLDQLQRLGYQTHLTVLNALNFGVAQKRERTFIVGFKKPRPFHFPLAASCAQASLDEVLEPEADTDPSLQGSEYIKNKRMLRAKSQGAKIIRPSVWHENKGGHLGIHPFSCALRHNASHNYLMVNGERRLSARESLRLQGFPDSYAFDLSHKDIRSQAGNAVAVPVIAALASEIQRSLCLPVLDDAFVKGTLF